MQHLLGLFSWGVRTMTVVGLLVSYVVVFLVGQFRGRVIEGKARDYLLKQGSAFKASAEKTAADLMHKLPRQGGSALLELCVAFVAMFSVVLVAADRTVLGTLFVSGMFVLGIGLHILLQSWVVVNGGDPAKGNPEINSYRAYFRKRGVLVAVRTFISLCFLLVYVGSKGSAALEDGAGAQFFNWTAFSVLARGGSVGIYGLLSDFFVDKIFARLGWQHALEVPGAPPKT